MKIPHWFHHIFNPHCPRCEKLAQEEFDFERDQFEATKLDFDFVKMELARAHRLNETLIEKLTAKPIVEERSVLIPEEVQRQLKTPWKIKRQLLEEADADKARVQKELQESLKSVPVLTEADLDKELASLKGH